MRFIWTLYLDNGTIEFQEFLTMVSSNNEENTNCETNSEKLSEKEMLIAFRSFDKDSNGFLTKDEISDVLKSIGKTLTDEEMEMYIQVTDSDEDGKVNYEGLLAIIVF